MSKMKIEKIATLTFNLENPDDMREYRTVVNCHKVERAMRRFLHYTAANYSPEINRKLLEILEDNLVFLDDLND